MGWLLLLLAMVPLGYLVARRWIVVALPILLVVLITGGSLVENAKDPCERPAGCGAGPVMGAALWSLIIAGLVAALLSLGVRLRRRDGGTRRGHPAR